MLILISVIPLLLFRHPLPRKNKNSLLMWSSHPPVCDLVCQLNNSTRY